MFILFQLKKHWIQQQFHDTQDNHGCGWLAQGTCVSLRRFKAAARLFAMVEQENAG